MLYIVSVFLFYSRCPVGQRFIQGTYLGELCESINECAEQAGLCHRGVCLDTLTGYECQCQSGYEGDTCAVTRELAAAASVSTGAWLIILICAVLLCCEYSRVVNNLGSSFCVAEILASVFSV